MIISQEVKTEFGNLLEDIVKEISSIEKVHQGKKVFKTYIPRHDFGDIRRKDTLFGHTTIAMAKIHKNEGVTVFVYEKPAYKKIEEIAEKYWGKFTEINVYGEFNRTKNGK